jgi:hypothetical protein
MKSISMAIFVGLLVAACAHRDAGDSKLRQQIVGTWSQSAVAEITFLSNGSFHSDVKWVDCDARIDGKWHVSSGELVVSSKHVTDTYKPWATNIYSVSGAPNPTFHKVLAVDGTHLTIVTDDLQMGAQTNSWERR